MIELKGIEGFRAALGEANGKRNWQSRCTAVGEWHGYEWGWGAWNTATCCAQTTQWRRIPDPKTVDSELPVEMAAERAEAWLGTPGHYAVNCKGGGIGHGDSPFPLRYPPYTPLVPLTRGQLAEIERLTEALGAFEVELDATRKERDSALGSQKAALAALEQERVRHNDTRRAVVDGLHRQVKFTELIDTLQSELSALCARCSDVEMSARTAKELAISTHNKSAGKESGG
jgi:hypothetical protein